MTSPMEGFLENIFTKEVSLVGKPANKRKFLLTKTEEGTMEELLKVVMETEADSEAEVIKALEDRGLSDKSIESARAIIRLTNAYSDEIDRDAFMQIGKSLGFEFETETETEETDITKSDLDQLPEEVRDKVAAVTKANEDLKGRLETVEKALNEAEEERQLAEWTEKARELEHLSRPADELGEMLKTVADNAGEEAANNVLESFRSVNNTVENADVFKTYGAPGAGQTGSAEQRLTEHARNIRKSSDNELTAGQAFDRAMEENPELAREYRQQFGRR